jgi:hypothetical protein
MSAARPQPIPDPPPGIVYLRSPDAVLALRNLDAYQHLLLRAWDTLGLSGVLVIRGIPTVYVREDDGELPPGEVAMLHRQFWNQGVATLLVLIDRVKTRVFSSMVAPQKLTPSQMKGNQPLGAFVEQLNIAGQALRAHHSEATDAYHTLCRQVASGYYYRRPEHSQKFNPRETVDAYLLDNLSAVRDELTRGKGKLDVQTAHAFLGRLLFTCYLIDRGVIELQNYFPGQKWSKLQQVLVAGTPEEIFGHLYGTLFPKLKREFNGSMFDDDLAAEQEGIRPQHLKTVGDFFAGHEIRKNQRTLGFWPYDFQFIPVETISAIYENFLEKEGEREKRESGAYYTPRFLAEMTLDVALEGVASLADKRFLDPSCGSGIFLVLLFNRLAAQWSAAHPTGEFKSPTAAYAAKDKALRTMLASLRGVDKNLTACRIACFSIYLAFLDQFTPNDVRAYIQQSDAGKLPNLLRYKEGRGRRLDIPVIWEGDFLVLAKAWEGDKTERFDFVVGNPPWAGRGKKQIAQDFMSAAPTLLTGTGRACLLLPTKVFFNKTDAFQDAWLRQVTLEKMIQLADYSFILFTNALCPCVVARFTNQQPDVATHIVEYLTPKVTRVDFRQGVIPIAPYDRKEIPLRVLIGAAAQKLATVAWKSRFWGTQRDLEFLNHLSALPKLSDYAGSEAKVKKGLCRWLAGEGFQPLKPNSKTDNPKKREWPLSNLVVAAEQISGLAFLPQTFATPLGAYLKNRGYRLDVLHRPRAEGIYKPPLVLFNRGFTDAAFFDFPVRFQHALRSIAGKREDEDLLLFLAAYLRSKLARYFIFHTSASLGSERDQVHSFEVLHLPFYLPTDQNRFVPKAEALMRQVVAKLRSLKQRMEESAGKLEDRLNPKSFQLNYSNEGSKEEEHKNWFSDWTKKTVKVQAEIEPLLYEYFGVIEQERALVEDTCDIFDKSDTPNTIDASMPTLESLHGEGLESYAGMLTDTLLEWSREKTLGLSTFAGVDAKLGIALLKVEQTKGNHAFRTAPLAKELAEALRRLEESATTSNGSLKYIRDETWFFDGPRVYIAKPALRGRWTRTAALNDAAEIHATIQFSRYSKT